MHPHSPRLRYRELRAEDTGQLYALATDPHVRRHLFDGAIVSRAWAEAAVEASHRRFEERGVGLWLLFEPPAGDTDGDGGPIGFAGFWSLDELGPDPQLVCALTAPHTGRGYAREAAASIIEVARARACAGDIRAAVDESNSAAIAVLERLGFEHRRTAPGELGRMFYFRLPARVPPRELRTERLILRPWRDTDVPPFAAMNADPAVMEHFPALLGRRESDALAERIRAGFAANGFGLWALEVPGAAPFIGFAGLIEPIFDAHFTPCIEIGWRLAASHWGRGYATEAARQLLRVGFFHLNLDEIVSLTTPGNWRSRRVMKRLGMSHDPKDDFDHPRLAVGHPLRRHVLYRLRRDAWRRAAKG